MHLVDVKQFAGLLTLVIGVAGFGMVLWAIRFMTPATSPMIRHLRRVYIADGLKFLVTAGFGYAGLFVMDTWFWSSLYIIRVFVLLYLIVSLYIFFQHVKNIRE